MGTLIRRSALSALILLAWLAEAHAQFKTATGHVKAAQPHPTARYKGVMARPKIPMRNTYRNPGTNRGYGKSGMNRVNANQNNTAVLTALNSSLTTLANAEHDYNGHRVRAMHEVSAAIRHMQPAGSRAVNPGITPGASARVLAGFGAGGNVPRPRMPQATSDAHLRDALRSLSTIQTRMNTQGQAGNRNHVQARSSVQRATQELRLALNVR